MDGATRGMMRGFSVSTATSMGFCYSMNSVLSEERKEIRLPIGRTESTVNRQNRSINAAGFHRFLLYRIANKLTEFGYISGALGG